MNVVIKGITFKSKEEACRYFGVSRYRLNKYYCGNHNTKTVYYLYRGEKFSSLRHIASLSNVALHYRTLYNRFKDKKDSLPTKVLPMEKLVEVDSIVDVPKYDASKRVVIKLNEVYNGVVCTTIKELSEASGIEAAKLRRRYNAGFTGAALIYRNSLNTNFRSKTLQKHKAFRTKEYLNSDKISYTQPGIRKMAEISEKYDVITLRVKVPRNGVSVRVRNLIT